MAAKIRIGCSGWNYRHWRGAFYPPDLAQKDWFAFYAGVFDTVEINNSFYRLPKAETFAQWRDRAPQHFRYAVKAPRLITHMKKLKEVDEPLSRFLDHARALDDRLGPILYQLPPRWKFNRERLESFLALLPRDLVHVFEFRDPSWMTDEVLTLLDQRGASFCTHDMPGLDVPRRAVGPVAYVRFHGTGGKYWGRYPVKLLRGWCDWIVGEAARGRDIWAYFNNDIHADAIAGARALIAMVKKAEA